MTESTNLIAAMTIRSVLKLPATATDLDVLRALCELLGTLQRIRLQLDPLVELPKEIGQ